MKHLALVLLVACLLLAGCHGRAGDYIPASSISRNGFAIDANEIRRLQDRELKLWGYVDHGNLYGDEGARQILQDWWSGEGPTAETWRFNLKAKPDDAVGQSFAVHIPNGPGRDKLLRAFLADAEMQKPTQVFLKGQIFTFDAPTNAGLLTGLRMELQSSDDIALVLPTGK